VNFDAGDLMVQVLFKYICGRVGFEGADKFRQPFAFLLTRDVPVVAGQEEPKEANQVEQQLGVQPLQSALLSMKTLPEFQVVLSVEDINRFKLNLKKQSEPEILAAAEFLVQILKCLQQRHLGLKQKDQQEDTDLTLVDAGEKWLDARIPKGLRYLKLTKLCYIHSLASILIEKYNDRCFLFADLPGELDEEFSPEIRADCDKISALLLAARSDDLSVWRQVIQTLTEFFLEPETQNQLQACLGGQTIRQIFAKNLQLFSFNLPLKFIETLVPNSIHAEHYANYMRFLHRICGDLGSYKKKLEKAKSMGNFYKEKVPVDVEAVQVALVEAEPILEPGPLQENREPAGEDLQDLYISEMPADLMQNIVPIKNLLPTPTDTRFASATGEFTSKEGKQEIEPPEVGTPSPIHSAQSAPLSVEATNNKVSGIQVCGS
jgi:hypothetical protein